MKKLFFLIPILAACHTKSLDFYYLDAWEGKWESSNSNSTFQETWNRVNDTLYFGRGLMMIQEDTILNEEIKLVFNKSEVQYLVKVQGQNDNRIVPFTMIQFSKDTWVFENLKHDFPKRITYFLKSTDSLIAIVEGIQDTIPRSLTLRFKRI